MGEPKIIIKNFNFFYGEKKVLNNLNLQIAANEILALFGPANSGITTLLRALNRLCDLKPDARFDGKILLCGSKHDVRAEGETLIAGKDTEGKNIFDADVSVTTLRRKVGMVFDIPTPLPMSIFDNVAYGPRLIGIRNKSVLEATVEQALRTAALWDDVKERLKTPAMSLSGGQQQRLCIARVLALEPEVILLDRPCSGLDPISTAKIEEALVMLKERLTIVLAPHNTQQAARVSDRAAFMLKGSLIEEGTNVEIFANPKDKRTADYITGRFG